MTVTTISFRDTWRFESPDTNFNTINVDGLSGSDGIIRLNGANILTYISSVSSLQSDLIISISSTLDNFLTIYQADSAIFNNTTISFNASSPIWNDILTTVQSNSATTWNYQGTDLKELTANYATISGASFTTGITTNTISISTHMGMTNDKKVILMDADGNSFEAFLRSGILTID